MTADHPIDSRTITELFSVTTLRGLARKGPSRHLACQLTKLSSTLPSGDAPLARAFDAVFAQLRRPHLRNDYVYRAALIEEALAGDPTPAILSEIYIAGRKADLIVLGKTTPVLEIKSERDGLARLADQLAAYRKAFMHVEVVTAEVHVEKVRRAVPETVGIRLLDNSGRLVQLREIRTDSRDLDPLVMLDCLRSAEASAVLASLGIDAPQVPNTQMRRRLADLFRGLPPAELHGEMIATLRHQRISVDQRRLAQKLPASLRPIAYSLKLTRREQQRLLKNLAAPLTDYLIS